MPGNPYSSQVHIDSALTNLSVAYIQERKNFIADQVFPIVPVQKKSDRYFKYLKEDWFRDEAAVRAAGTESAGGGYDIDNTPNYSCIRYAYHKDVTDEDRENADTPLKPDEDATQFVTQKLLLRREAVFANKYLTTGVWSKDLSGVTSSATEGTSFIQWSDYSASNPAKDIAYAKQYILSTTGFEPNVLTMTYDVWSKLTNNPIVYDRIKYTTPALAGKIAQILAQYFDVDKVVVAKSVINSAAKGATANFGFQSAKSVLLSYAAPNPGIKQPSAGYIFAWTGLMGTGAYGNRVVKFPVPLRGIDTIRVEGEMCFDTQIVGSDLGVFLTNVI